MITASAQVQENQVVVPVVAVPSEAAVHGQPQVVMAQVQPSGVAVASPIPVVAATQAVAVQPNVVIPVR